MQDWDKEFMPWLASLPEEEQLEVADILLQIMATAMERKFHGRVSGLHMPEFANVSRPLGDSRAGMI